MKNKKLEALSMATLLASSISANAFNNGDVIGFDPGVVTCLAGLGTPPLSCSYGTKVETGSYFAMDVNGDGRFSSSERTPIIPGPDGGIVLGALQPSPGIDQPWVFFNTGIPGMHQTTITPVTQNPDGSLDFSGWEVTWNNMLLPLGSGPNATVSCGGKSSCATSDLYQIDYTGYVTSGLFSNFGYQLHLEQINSLPSLHVALSIAGGGVQECASTGGHNVLATASVSLLNGAQLDTIHWTVDGQDMGMGASVSPFLSLGAHTISVAAIGISGNQDTASTTVTVVDKTRPVINATFIDNRSGTEISSIDTKNSSFIDVRMSATDICDASPSISGTGGFALTDGDTLKIQGNQDKVELKTSILEMVVRSSDSSKNGAYLKKILTITP